MQLGRSSGQDLCGGRVGLCRDRRRCSSGACRRDIRMLLCLYELTPICTIERGSSSAVSSRKARSILIEKFGRYRWVHKYRAVLAGQNGNFRCRCIRIRYPERLWGRSISTQPRARNQYVHPAATGICIRRLHWELRCCYGYGWCSRREFKRWHIKCI